MNLHSYILNNTEKLPTHTFNRLVKEQHLESLANFLKRKFPKDTRSIPQLMMLIKQEYRLSQRSFKLLQKISRAVIARVFHLLSLAAPLSSLRFVFFQDETGSAVPYKLLLRQLWLMHWLEIPENQVRFLEVTPNTCSSQSERNYMTTPNTDQGRQMIPLRLAAGYLTLNQESVVRIHEGEPNYESSSSQ